MSLYLCASVYHPVIGRQRLCRLLGELGVRCVGMFGDGFRNYGEGVKARMINSLKIFTSLEAFFRSFGGLTADYSNLLYVAVKEAQIDIGRGESLDQTAKASNVNRRWR